jgi:phosphoribosylamine---glycine ligase
VPTARYETFTEPGPAVSFLRSLPPPWVVKTDGLAAGKGVLVTDDIDAAMADVSAKLSGAAFGDAGRRVVIEEGLTGAEVSVQALCDGTRAVALPPAQDFKRANDGDAGPNTGGLGAYSPVPFVSGEVVEHVLDVAVRPTLTELGARGIDYRGVLYAGLMLTPDGPKVLEFNVRFGDPETQVVLPRWEGDVAAVLAAAAAGRLCDVSPPDVSSEAAVCVVLAAPGYPANPSVGAAIEGLSAFARRDDVSVYAAGVGQGLVTAGGRVLSVTATGKTIAEARQRAYGAVEDVQWPGMQYRRDIAAVAAEEDMLR